MFQRFLTQPLVTAAALMPVVTLTGPHQSGKTTLVRQAFPGHGYVSLEHAEERREGLEDLRSLLARFPDGVILDEVQRVPELLSYSQVEVDRDDRPGRFILTGS